MYLVAVLQTIAFNHEAPRMHIVADGESWDEETDHAGGVQWHRVKGAVSPLPRMPTYRMDI